MRLLDLFCGAGGASMGYSLAGFDVTGVDIKPQPRYPFKFRQGDWSDFCLDEFDAIHASPPCQGYSQTRHLPNCKGGKRLISEVRNALDRSNKPYVIENVAGARGSMINYIRLRGNMFELQVKRDRLFETNFFVPQPDLAPELRAARSHRGNSRLVPGGIVTVAGNIFTLEEASIAMGIDWMNRKEIAQSIPPSYTQWVGGHLMNHLTGGKSTGIGAQMSLFC